MAKSPPVTPSSDYVLGKDIDLSSWNDSIAIDQTGRPFCIVGYMHEVQPESLPYFSASAASRTPKARESYRFVRLIGGALVQTGFLSDDAYYRVLKDRRLILPTGTRSYFGVTKPSEKWGEDTDLTQAIFGGTVEEVEAVAMSLAKTFGRAGYQQPRVTFSGKRANKCDLSGALIPSEFPYLAFEDSQRTWGHVSLYGFFRLLSLTCAQQSPIRRFLMEDGVDESLLDRFIQTAHNTSTPLMSRA
jgi:hypothetical protein